MEVIKECLTALIAPIDLVFVLHYLLAVEFNNAKPLHIQGTIRRKPKLHNHP
jgi:hypothetical protein